MLMQNLSDAMSTSFDKKSNPRNGGFDQDFVASWVYLKRQIKAAFINKEEKFSIHNFEDVWSALSNFDTSWQIVEQKIGPDSKELYWVKVINSEVDKSVLDSDGCRKFSTESALLQYVHEQAILLGDEELIQWKNQTVEKNPLTPLPEIVTTSDVIISWSKSSLSNKDALANSHSTPNSSLALKSKEENAIIIEDDKPLDLQVGTEVDIVSEDIYCAAKVIRVNSKKSVRISYVGWDKSYDEDISDISRLLPGFSYVQRIKLFVNLPYIKFSSWPCIGYLRVPVKGKADVVNFLKEESTIFVVPCGKSSQLIQWISSGLWISTSSIESFTENNLRKFRTKVRVDKYTSSSHKMAFENSVRELLDISYARVLNSMHFVGALEMETYEELLAGAIPHKASNTATSSYNNRLEYDTIPRSSNSSTPSLEIIWSSKSPKRPMESVEEETGDFVEKRRRQSWKRNLELVIGDQDAEYGGLRHAISIYQQNCDRNRGAVNPDMPGRNNPQQSDEFFDELRIGDSVSYLSRKESE